MNIHILHTSIKEIQTKLIINNQKHGKTSHGAKLRTSLAQAKDPRSSEMDLSLKLHVLP